MLTPCVLTNWELTCRLKRGICTVRTQEAALEAERIRREKLAEQKKRQEEMREKALMLLAKSADDDAEDSVTTKKDATEEI